MDSYYNLLVAWLVLCVAAGFYLLFKTAPYGRYLRDGWGVQVPSRLGWILFESPPVFLMIVFFILYSDQSWVQIIFLSIWLSHYINRSLIWPLKAKISGKPMPLLIILFRFRLQCYKCLPSRELDFCSWRVFNLLVNQQAFYRGFNNFLHWYVHQHYFR